MKTKTNRFTEVCQLDVCTSDYFSGYKYPVIAIPLYNGMTAIELSDAIQSEINATFEYLCNDYSENAFTEDELKIFNEYCEDLKKQRDAIVYHNSIEESEDCESVYMYLSLCKPVKRYGMTFLNA